MDLENVCGIIIGEDGIPHSFGINKMEYSDELKDENFHSKSFLKDIYSCEWFQEKNVPFNLEKGVLSQLDVLAKYGFTTICNGSSVIINQAPYYSYFINMPINPSDNVKEYLSSIYEHIKELIEENQAYFEGNTFDENGNYSSLGLIYNLDDFYDALGISKGISIHK